MIGTQQRSNDGEKIPGRILVTDDEPAMRMALREVLQRNGWQVELADGGEQALGKLGQEAPYDLLITDFRMGEGMSGLDLLRAARQLRPQLPMVMMTAFGTVEDAVVAMREGASDYLLKPFSMETVIEVVHRVRGTAARATSDSPAITRPVTAHSPSQQEGSDGTFQMIAKSPAQNQILDIAREVAESDATVLLTGESGVGKEVVARYLHHHSGRRGPLVAINCAALPEGLLESELFGHEKGAFTGAILSRKGRFEQASEGTLLLDEISEMPLALQAKLLRVIQEKEISPLGGAGSIRLDVRIIATTNRDLDRAIAEGSFRQDLFYRLNVIGLPIPPLRQRTEDIIPLAHHFVRKFHRSGRPEQHLTDEVNRYLQTYDWPGNVRELENMIERACLLTRGESIRREDLHLPLTPGARATADPRNEAILNLNEQITLDEVERRLILHTLDNNGGNRTRAAERLGVSVRTIRNKLHQYGVVEAV